MAKKPKPAPKGLALARPGDPYVLPDGRMLYEDNDDELEEDEPDLSDNPTPLSTSAPATIPVATPEAKDFRPNASRVLKDITVPANVFQAAAIVFVYTMYGISNVEICDATALTMDELNKLRSHRVYSEIFDAMLNEFVNANSSILQSRIAAASHNALGSVVHWAGTRAPKIAGVGLKASIDLLDRAGARPQDMQQRNNSMLNELRIVVSDETEHSTIRVTKNGKDVFDDYQDFTIEEIEEEISDGDSTGQG